MIVAIHQPNYFPWLGYFYKISECDTFVFLDHVPLPQGRSYTQRVQILVQSDPHWLTVPVLKSGRSGQSITEVEYNPSENWRRTHRKTLQMNYGNHSYYDEVFPVVEDILGRDDLPLAELNIYAVKLLSEELGLESEFVRSSTLDLPDVHKNELLAIITESVGGTVYLHGSGAEDYQQEEIFDEAGLELRSRQFDHPTYPQEGSDDFVDGLSILDCLFNVGFDETGKLLQQLGQ